jgi:hypothetical protein
MEVKPASPTEPDPPTRQFYVNVMTHLDEAKIPYVVGGGYAMAYYTGIARNTKDLDLFIRLKDRDRALKVLSIVGYRTEFFYEFWIAKVLSGDAFVDMLYNSGNGLCPVDDDWFKHSVEQEVLGYRTRLVPAEEQLFSKAFVQDRDRYDGADVAHLLLARADKMDWKRLLRRFESHERVLLSHLILFGYVYPCEKRAIPGWVMEHLMNAMKHEKTDQMERICLGTNVSQKGYGTAMREWGFVDGRLQPHGPLNEDQLRQLPEP